MSVTPHASVLENAATTEETSGAVFDRQVFRGILNRVTDERARLGGSLARRLGMGGTELTMLLAEYDADQHELTAEDYVAADESEEQVWVRDLLMRNRTSNTAAARWLAAIIARRALEAGHLWEDLGLQDRPTLRQLMDRHFQPLSQRNEKMRWKRFFYRCLCEEEGMSHCTSPTCSGCPEVPVCFMPESAEAMIALAKRAPE